MVADANNFGGNGGSGLSTAAPSGNFDTPLLDFWITGCGFEIKGGTSKKGNAWKRVSFRGIDLEVIETSEVYTDSQVEFSLFYNDPTKSARRREGQGISEWEAFCESLRSFYGDVDPFIDLFGGVVAGEGSQPSKLGRRMRVKKIPTFMNVPPDLNSEDETARTKYHNAMTAAFKVVEIQGLVAQVPVPGFGGSANGNKPAETIEDYLVTLSEGKHINTFYEDALDDPRVMANPGVITKLADRAWHVEAEQAGRIKIEPDGTIHKT